METGGGTAQQRAARGRRRSPGDRLRRARGGGPGLGQFQVCSATIFIGGSTLVIVLVIVLIVLLI